MANIWPYFKLTFSFTENAPDGLVPQISEWICNALPSGANFVFDNDIRYIYDDNSQHESLNVTQNSGQNYATVTYKYFNGSPISDPDEPLITMVWKCDINSDGSLDVGNAVLQEGYTPDEDTTFTYTKLNYNASTPSLKIELPDFVWAYNETYEVWIWYHPDDALELGIAGGGRFKRRLIVLTNNKIYFSDEL